MFARRRGAAPLRGWISDGCPYRRRERLRQDLCFSWYSKPSLWERTGFGNAARWLERRITNQGVLMERLLIGGGGDPFGGLLGWFQLGDRGFRSGNGPKRRVGKEAADQLG